MTLAGALSKSIHPHLHAANVDLKAFREEFYKTQCKAKLAPVLESLKIMKRMGVWVEVTTLIIPTLNDSREEFKELARFIAEELGPGDALAYQPLSSDLPLDRLADNTGENLAAGLGDRERAGPAVCLYRQRPRGSGGKDLMLSLRSFAPGSLWVFHFEK